LDAKRPVKAETPVKIVAQTSPAFPQLGKWSEAG
jgi:hypothetical protein